jgi:MFS transporter, ACS family, tartrate transporter
MLELETRTIRKITWRLLPFLILCYFIAFLDRVNVGFAHSQMVESLGMSEAAFGFGAGVFFIAYFLVEVPSNVLLERFGARMWIARIMVTWGMISAAFAFIPDIAHYTGLSTEWTFYMLRFLLGLAEAGFYPGIVFYLTMWFPSIYRARVIGLFMLAIPLSSIVGSPISGALLNVSGWGWEGWQWLFFLEAMPSVLLGIVVFFYLDDFPRGAKWLRKDEVDWLIDRLETEAAGHKASGHGGFLKMMLNPQVLWCTLVYFCALAAGYAISTFLPQIVSKMGFGNFETGLVLAGPAALGAISMTWMCRNSDRTGERKLHVAASMLMIAVGIAGGALADAPVVRLLFFSLATMGSYSMTPIFWSIPSAIIPKAKLAAGIAAINSLAALGGFFGPMAFGYIKTMTGSPVPSLLAMAGVAFVGAVVAVTLRVTREAPKAVAGADMATAQ